MGDLYRGLTTAKKHLANSACEDFIVGTRLAGLPVKYNSSIFTGTGVAPYGANRQEFHLPTM